MKRYFKFVLVVGVIFFVVCETRNIFALKPPYPPSPVISGIIWDFSSHERRALGSDNWPITWADDNHQYTSWGDGGGFGGTNTDGRVSLGIARVEGPSTSYHGFNVWGGKNSEVPATFGGKSYGIISIGGHLYMWVSPGSGTDGYISQTVYKSVDHAHTWQKANWSFMKKDNLIAPTFLQFGMDYDGARDNYVYVYAIRLKDDTCLKIQKPGQIDLLRVPKEKIVERSAYEFFAGLDGKNNPIWSLDISARQPVFEDPNGVGWNVSVSYNARLGRYLLCTEHVKSFEGNLGIFDAPEPWGPWTTVLYTRLFGAPTVEATTFFWNFSNIWLGADGKDFVLVFTGIGSNDSWNTVKGSFVISDTTPPTTPTRLPKGGIM